jgi:adenylate cyclase
MSAEKTTQDSPTVDMMRSGAAVQGVSDWLIAQALGHIRLDSLFGELGERLVDAGVPVMRGLLAMSTLHPMFEATSFSWLRDGGAEITHFRRGASVEEVWQRRPPAYMMKNDMAELRARLDDAKEHSRFPLWEELADQGATDYLAFVTPFTDVLGAASRRDGMITSWATDRPGGFAEHHVQALKRLQLRLGVAVKIATREQTAINVVSAYLGPHAGRRVLKGQIGLGDVETIPAVIWFSDLRDSTAISERLDADAFLDVLNDYFECAAGSVLDHGGEVLRFIGGAVLAIFSIEGPGGPERAARMALAASRDASARMAAVNARRAADGADAIAFGVGLHFGELLFGNIGVPERIEFSVIGRAANEASRLEGLTKSLERSLVVSAAFARLVPLEWENLGRHRLAGVSEESEVFAPPP